MWVYQQDWRRNMTAIQFAKWLVKNHTADKTTLLNKFNTLSIEDQERIKRCFIAGR